MFERFNSVQPRLIPAGCPRLVNRRQLLSLGAATACALIGSPALAGAVLSEDNAAARRAVHARFGPLRTPDVNDVQLPAGFSSRVVARSRHAPLPDKPYLWHDAPDGGATFATPDGGWIYVSNCEISGNGGGVGALRFSATGELIDAYAILGGTNLNCAGGPTPWETWLSCEEHPSGRVWECDPFGRTMPRAWPALGVFTHEAVAVDPVRMQLYLTEDVPDGRWYRFTPQNIAATRVPDLSAGLLEALEVVSPDGQVSWHRINDPAAIREPTRHQAPVSTKFDGGEGCWYADGCIYFSTKGDNRVWSYDIAAERLRVIYDARAYSNPILTGVDNVVVSRQGDVLVAEDNGDMQIVAITADRQVIPVVQVAHHRWSEMTGPAFDPSGTRLYFSSQRGASGRSRDGVTYEVTGPFND